MPLTTEQRESLRAREGSNVLYIKEDSAVYWSSKRVDPRKMFDDRNIVELREAYKACKMDNPSDRVKVVHV